jgi:hypothetical protein
MFYVKQDFGYAEVKTEITDENVFTTCPKCGCELNVDLVELFSDREADLCGTAVYCSKYSKERQVRHPSKRLKCHQPITQSEIARVLRVLQIGGYGEEISEVYHEFGIAYLRDLTVDQYEGFINRLEDIASGDFPDKGGAT